MRRVIVLAAICILTGAMNTFAIAWFCAWRATFSSMWWSGSVRAILLPCPKSAASSYRTRLAFADGTCGDLDFEGEV